LEVEHWDKKEAVSIAEEALWQLAKCRKDFPRACEFVARKMDVSDTAIEEANKLLHPNEPL